MQAILEEPQFHNGYWGDDAAQYSGGTHVLSVNCRIAAGAFCQNNCLKHEASAAGLAEISVLLGCTSADSSQAQVIKRRC
jgi:hypothetical protein